MLRANPAIVVLPREQIEAGLVFVAVSNGATRVGFAALLRPAEGDEIELDGLFVEPVHWKQGAGRALVEHCAAFAREQGASRLNVIANLHSVGFYQRCGFRETGPFATPFGAALRMTREL